MNIESIVIDLLENYSLTDEQRSLIQKLNVPVYVLEDTGKEITLRDSHGNILYQGKATDWKEISSIISPQNDGATYILTTDANGKLLEALKNNEVEIKKIKSSTDLTENLKELSKNISEEKATKKSPIYGNFVKKPEVSNEKIYGFFQNKNKENYYLQDMPRKTEISSQVGKGSRLDKRIFDEGDKKLKHTLIISETGKKYELIGTLDSKESRELYKQTGMKKRRKVELGGGVSGRVRLLKSVETGEYFAVKKVRKIQQFEGEKKINEALNEKHLEGVLTATDSLEAVDSKGRMTRYQIMPIANSGTGRDLINNVLPNLNAKEREIVSTELTFSLTKTFSGMNEAGFYHRDFKPENLLINNRKIYVPDFGSATLYENEDLIYDAGPADSSYFSPESVDQQLENRERDANLDSWRLGLTLFQTLSPDAAQYAKKYLLPTYQWLTGTSYDTKLKYYKDVLDSEEFKMHLENVSHPVARVIRGLLEPDYKQRITIQEAEKELSKIERDSQIVDSTFDKAKYYALQGAEKHGRQKELKRVGNIEEKEVATFKKDAEKRRERLRFVGGDNRSLMGKFAFKDNRFFGKKITSEVNKQDQPEETKEIKPK